MQSITFALPTLATGSMSKADQVDVLLNQATAAIVCCYLEHINILVDKVPPGSTSTPTGTFQIITQAELVSLINDVQLALRSI